MTGREALLKTSAGGKTASTISFICAENVTDVHNVHFPVSSGTLPNAFFYFFPVLTDVKGCF